MKMEVDWSHLEKGKKTPLKDKNWSGIRKGQAGREGAEELDREVFSMSKGLWQNMA
jgi:hypothetical protein